MQTIKEYFTFYSNIKSKGTKLKKFSFLDKQISLIKYLKNNKNEIIRNINYAFVESKEPYLLSVFSENNIHFIHINARICKDYPKIFDSIYEYENYLAIYGTFAVLIDINFQAESLEDSRIFFKDFLEDLTFKIYYDEAFRLNLESFVDEQNEVLKYVYRYGYDFLLQCFKLFYKDTFDALNYSHIMRFLQMNDLEFKELFGLYKSKIILEDE